MMRRGRKRNPNARTSQAAQLALYLLHNRVGMPGYEPPCSEHAAAQQAADAWGVSADNVRKYMRQMRSLTVTVTQPAQHLGWLGTFPAQTKQIPVLTHTAAIKTPEDLACADAEFALMLARSNPELST